MATKTLAQLPVAGAISQTDILHTEQSGVDAQVSADALSSYVLRSSRYAQVSVAITTTTTISISPTVQNQVVEATMAGTGYTVTFPAVTSATFPCRVAVVRFGAASQGVLSLAGLNNYGGTVKLFNDQDCAVVEVVNTTGSTYAWELVGVMTTGSVPLSSTPFTSTFGDMAKGFDITTGAGNFVFNLPALSSCPGKEYIIGKVDAGAGAVAVTPNGSDPIGTVNAAYSLAYQGATLHIINGGTAWEIIAGPAVLSLTSGSPFTLTSGVYAEVVINASTNPYVLNLPAAKGTGYRVKIINANSAIAGLVQIAPNGTDHIGSAGNVSIYLQNTDQGGNINYSQSVELLDSLTGYWVVTAGQYCPAQSTDSNGSQYHLGKLHHLPLGNTTSRKPTVTNPGAGAWTSAIQITGSYGVPAGAKGIRLRLLLSISGVNTAGEVTIGLAFSDNNSSTPTTSTAHPYVLLDSYAAITGLAQASTSGEIDVPLNSSGQFYAYGLGVQSLQGGAVIITVAVVGYYMGD